MRHSLSLTLRQRNPARRADHLEPVPNYKAQNTQVRLFVFLSAPLALLHRHASLYPHSRKILQTGAN